MVKICPNTYPSENNETYENHFNLFPFPLSPFQQWSIQSIVEGNHVLTCAHTGSGKTISAEFAIQYFVGLKKKVIYTSPIKALSNQKFYEFTQKYPHISFGIITGDIKCNPEAQVIIMTAEILLNKLATNVNVITGSESKPKTTGYLDFDINIETELACVVMDEVHYINDVDRGGVWEETIMLLPPHIQMVMLSATLDTPEVFAKWIETCKCKDNTKQVYLTYTDHRVVPLTHYSFISCTSGLFKGLKDKVLESEITKTINTLHVIQDAKGTFNEPNYLKIKKTLELFQTKNHYVKRQHVLNQVTKYMVEKNMLPAICFVLSRKALEICANEVTTPLLEDDSKTGYIVAKECENIIRKLPNFQEYLNLPEYVNVVSLLEKGIGIHHAGIMPVLREMVELMFAKGHVKLLFATETFAVGINMPTKTVVMTDVNKFDGTGMRILYSHEYTQMAGRAGRRGIDTIGSVIHLTNLFKGGTDMTSLKTMMRGKPQRLVSKYKISYHLVLTLINNGETSLSAHTQQSMIQNEINAQKNVLSIELDNKKGDITKLETIIEHLKTPKEVCEKYISLKHTVKTSVNKGKRDAEKAIQSITNEYMNIEKDSEYISKWICKKDELTSLNKEIVDTETLLENNIQKMVELLKTKMFVTLNIGQDQEQQQVFTTTTTSGKIALVFKEVHSLTFANMICDTTNVFHTFTPDEIVAFLSCFTNISVSEELRTIPEHFFSTNKTILCVCLKEVYNSYQEYNEWEHQNYVNTGVDYHMTFDIVDYMLEWCRVTSEPECKQVLQKMGQESDIFLGEFVKAILKINNIVLELSMAAELVGNMELLYKLQKIPQLTMKYVATNQSLYV